MYALLTERLTNHLCSEVSRDSRLTKVVEFFLIKKKSQNMSHKTLIIRERKKGRER